MDTERTPLLHGPPRPSNFRAITCTIPCIHELEHTVYAETIANFDTLGSRIEATVSLETSAEAELVKSALVLLLLVRYFSGSAVGTSTYSWAHSLRITAEWKEKLVQRWVNLQKSSNDEETFCQLLLLTFRLEGGDKNFQSRSFLFN